MKRPLAALLLLAIALASVHFIVSTAEAVTPSAALEESRPGPLRSGGEVRALWVVRTAMVSPQSVHRVVELAKANGFNVLIAQVRGRGDAFYEGGLEPRSEALSKQPEEFDPLGALIRDAHASGLQVHAWLNSFYVWSGSALPKSPLHVVNVHPEWLLADANGVVQYAAGDDREGAYLNPSDPAARQFVHEVFLDVVRRYDVDGIHMDFIRYPGASYGFSDEDIRQFQDALGPDLSLEQVQALNASPNRNVYPEFFPDRWKQWRRDNVTELVRRVYRDVKQIKPNVVVSAASIPWGSYHGWSETDAYNSVCQDWFGWMREGILDVAVPMTYHTDTSSFSGWIQAAVSHRFDSRIWAGIGSYLVTPESTAEKIVAARRLGAQGFSVFSYDSITHDGMDDRYLRRVSDLAFSATPADPSDPWDRAHPR